jgi:coenzyme F420-reducing hydrogenase alpha subunit
MSNTLLLEMKSRAPVIEMYSKMGKAVVKAPAGKLPHHTT